MSIVFENFELRSILCETFIIFNMKLFRITQVKGEQEFMIHIVMTVLDRRRYSGKQNIRHQLSH